MILPEDEKRTYKAELSELSFNFWNPRRVPHSMNETQGNIHASSHRCVRNANRHWRDKGADHGRNASSCSTILPYSPSSPVYTSLSTRCAGKFSYVCMVGVGTATRDCQPSAGQCHNNGKKKVIAEQR